MKTISESFDEGVIENLVNEYDSLYDEFKTAVMGTGLGGRVIPSGRSQSGVVLTVLYACIGIDDGWVYKDELRDICQQILGHGSVDLQAPRHLKYQGWNIVGKQFGRSYAYKLNGLEVPPDFAGVARRADKLKAKDFRELCKEFDGRCATCGRPCSTLQQGHIDPRFSLLDDNCIPQCQECNVAALDYYVFGLEDELREWGRDNLYKVKGFLGRRGAKKRKRLADLFGDVIANYPLYAELDDTIL